MIYNVYLVRVQNMAWVKFPKDLLKHKGNE